MAINATLYAMDLLQEQQVNFTLLNIHVADGEVTEEEQEEKKSSNKSKATEKGRGS